MDKKTTETSGLYKTPNEYVHDLTHISMDEQIATDRRTLNVLICQSLAENDYSDLTEQDVDSIRQSIA